MKVPENRQRQMRVRRGMESLGVKAPQPEDSHLPLRRTGRFTSSATKKFTSSALRLIAPIGSQICYNLNIAKSCRPSRVDCFFIEVYWLPEILYETQALCQFIGIAISSDCRGNAIVGTHGCTGLQLSMVEEQVGLILFFITVSERRSHTLVSVTKSLAPYSA